MKKIYFLFLFIFFSCERKTTNEFRDEIIIVRTSDYNYSVHGKIINSNDGCIKFDSGYHDTVIVCGSYSIVKY